MNQESRIQKIDAIITQNNICGNQKILWKEESKSFNVYKIPLEYLIYNKYNGRVLSRTKSLETQGHLIDAESIEGKFVLEDLLWKSKEDRNKKTLEDLEKNGQLKTGIITRDGIIIDGNRRAMLLNKAKKTYFEAIILPVTLEEDPIAIQELETMYQMGEDSKLDYNPIEKYLKAFDLHSSGMSIQKIANLMGKSESDINTLIEVKQMMDDYLDYLDYHGQYTQLDGREDQLINLTKWIGNFRNSDGSKKAFDGYRSIDIDNLKYVAFDYIRIKYEGKKFRNLADGLKDKHIFGDKIIWNSFREKHYEFIQPILDNESSIRNDISNLKAYLDDRDDKFISAVQDFMDSNMNDHIEMIYNRRAKDEPQKLLSKANDALISIDHTKPLSPQCIAQINAIEDVMIKLVKKTSPLTLLNQILIQLSSIKYSDFNDEEKNIILEKIKEINRLTYRIEKENK